MSIAPTSTPSPSKLGARLSARLRPLRDRVEIRSRDAWRMARDRTAIAANVARTQSERAQGFVAFHARRRPVLVTALAAGGGLVAALLIRPRRARTA